LTPLDELSKNARRGGREPAAAEADALAGKKPMLSPFDRTERKRCCNASMPRSNASTRADQVVRGRAGLRCEGARGNLANQWPNTPSLEGLGNQRPAANARRCCVSAGAPE